MPILPPEIDIFPSDLFERAESLTQAGALWTVFYTLSRREKDLARKLLLAKIPFYAPLVARQNRSPSGRVRQSMVPLFPGYVFAACTSDERRMAMETNTISKTIAVSEWEPLIADLRSLRRLLETGHTVTSEPRFESGDAVRIRSGSMQGIEGKVVHRSGKDRLVLTVRFLNQGVSVELADLDVEQIESNL